MIHYNYYCYYFSIREILILYKVYSVHFSSISENLFNLIFFLSDVERFLNDFKEHLFSIQQNFINMPIILCVTVIVKFLKKIIL